MFWAQLVVVSKVLGGGELAAVDPDDSSQIDLNNTDTSWLYVEIPEFTNWGDL